MLESDKENVEATNVNVEKTKEQPVAAPAPKRRGRPRKNPLPADAAPVAKTEESPVAVAPAVAEQPAPAPAVAAAPATSQTVAPMDGVKTVQTATLNSRYNQTPTAQSANTAPSTAPAENSAPVSAAVPSEQQSVPPASGQVNGAGEAPVANGSQGNRGRDNYGSAQELMDHLNQMAGSGVPGQQNPTQQVLQFLLQNGYNIQGNRHQRQQFQQMNQMRNNRNLNNQGNRNNRNNNNRNNNNRPGNFYNNRQMMFMGGQPRGVMSFISGMPQRNEQMPYSEPQAPNNDVNPDGQSAPAPAENQTPVPELNVTELQNKSFVELKEFAEKFGIDGSGFFEKAELVSEILKANAANQGIMYGSGYLEIEPGKQGFLRSAQYNYLRSSQDIYLSLEQIRNYSLQNGDFVQGQIKPPQGKAVHFNMYKIDSINGEPAERKRDIIPFYEMVPDFPDERLIMETTPDDLSMRVLDLVTPIGKGQRGLIVAPPRTGKTVLMQQMAKAILTNNPEVKLIILLIDERPEEVTDMKRVVYDTAKNKNNVEIVSSTFDEEAERHVRVAKMVIEKAKRLAEYKHDVVILLDSITRLARAYNTVAPHSGKILTGGVDANALHEPKNFFGAARNLKGQKGSITILATALVDTGSKMDDVIFEEFKGTGNMELHLCRELVNRRVYPAIDIEASGTRREDLLLSPEEMQGMWKMRKFMNERNKVEGMETLIKKLKEIKTNKQLLMLLSNVQNC